MRHPIVVDTNVLVVANGGPAHTRKCAANCSAELMKIRESGQVVLDYGYEILKEYGNNQKATTGQPGVGFLFWKWLLDTRAGAEHCVRVTIKKGGARGYEEFPDHDDLSKFDFADRKFVAVAIVHGGRPPILQAVDTKWWGWKDALQECGVEVKFLCKEEIKAKFESAR